jgi:hypothetical protein
MRKDNTLLSAKVEIRKRLLSRLDSPSVLDCYAGAGHIRIACYAGLPYVGIDQKGGPGLVKMDNRKYLRSTDLSPFNFFDLDAYGNPWHQFMIVVSRRSRTRTPFAVVLTDGNAASFPRQDVAAIPMAMKKYIGIPERMEIPGLLRHQQFIRDLFVGQLLRQYSLSLSLSLSLGFRRIWYGGVVVAPVIK